MAAALRGVDVLDLTKAAAAVADLAELIGRLRLTADEISAARASASAPDGTLLVSVRAPDCVRLVLVDMAKLVDAFIARATTAAAPVFADTQPMGQR